MAFVQISVHAKYGPRIQREPYGTGRYLCLAYPCPNSTRLFYRPANSHLCPACIRKREPKDVPTRGATAPEGATTPASHTG